MAVERSELQLVWPPALFAADARALLAAGADDDTLGGLLAEAFHDGRAERLLQQVAREHPPRPPEAVVDIDARTVAEVYPGGGSVGPRATAELVAELVREAEHLPRYAQRRLWRQRQRAAPAAALTVAETKSRFADVVHELTGLGYLEDAFGSQCDDSRADPAAEGQRRLAARLEVDLPLWPVRPWHEDNVAPFRIEERWPDEVFLDVVEALHELVARPRRRFWHRFHDGWDYADHTRSAGQAVYRWRVNELLDRSEIPLRLADAGPDVGLLVHAAGDPRDDLGQRVLSTPEGSDRDEVAHAVALFRGRAAGREDKRSAVVTLARVLEQRRALLKAELLSQDEATLFEVANRYDLRHRRADQRPDYDDAYLDWVFWWYLATIELTDRLLTRQDQPGA